MSDPIIIERLTNEPIVIEGGPSIIVLDTNSGPFGPVANVSTAITLVVDGAGNVIIPGVKADLPVDWTGSIIGWMLLGDLAGSATVDILKGDPINAVPYASITGGAGPSMTAVDAAEGTVVGWTPDLAPGDVLRFQVVSLSTIRRLTIALFVERN